MSKNVKVVSFARTPAYVHHRAMLNRRDNNIIDALELLRKAAEECPENLDYRLDLAELYCEMGCHEQSNRLLLDMLAAGNGPAECYYGLALNQLGMDDPGGARRSLSLYRRMEPEGVHLEEVSRLADELDFYSRLAHSADRRLRRAAAIASRGCDAMSAEDSDRACRMFERSLAIASEQYDIRALYAMALLTADRTDEARAQAELACAGYPPSVKAMCVCAQVYALLGDGARAQTLIDRAFDERPEGNDLRLMIYAMTEMGMDDRVSECVRLALRETPFDRDLLHMRAVALKRTGMPDVRVARFWTRILRIDPEDSIARFYQEAALSGRLDEFDLGYTYQVPLREYKRRLNELVTQLSQGSDSMELRWREDPGFRQLLRWAVESEDSRLNRAGMTALSIIDDRESRSLLRCLLFSASVSPELKLHAALVLRLQGLDLGAILPPDTGLGGEMMPDVELMLARMSVGERQLVRYADEVLREEYDISALSQLLVMWSAYRQLRGTSAEPLRCVGAGAAALAYNYLLIYGPRPDIGALCAQFGCGTRQMVYYARRIAGSLESFSRDGQGRSPLSNTDLEITSDEDP